jgi:phospholipid transport system substrate-binding protein
MRMRSLPRTCLAALLAVGCFAAAPAVWAQAAAPAGSAAANPKAAEAMIKSLSDKAFAVLRDKSLTQPQREERFRTLLREGFELNFIGTSVLGLHRRTATPAQLAAFNQTFPDYVIRIYANRLTDYGNTNLKILGSQPVGTRGDIVVRSQVVGGSVTQPVQADWRLRAFPQGTRIIDLSIAGVSMALTQRDEFNARIQAKGLDGLIAELKTGGSAPATKTAQSSTKK